jgi:hypothetical protein
VVVGFTSLHLWAYVSTHNRTIGQLSIFGSKNVPLSHLYEGHYNTMNLDSIEKDCQDRTRHLGLVPHRMFNSSRTVNTNSTASSSLVSACDLSQSTAEHLSHVGERAVDRDLIEEQLAIMRQIEEEHQEIVATNSKFPPENRPYNLYGVYQDVAHTLAEDGNGVAPRLPRDQDAVQIQGFNYNVIQRKQLVQSNQANRMLATVPDSSVSDRNERIQTRVMHPMSSINETLICKGMEQRNDLLQDLASTLSNGQKLRVKGIHQTYKDISTGKAVLVKCPCCFTFLQVGNTSINIYCTICEHVSPMELARQADSSGSTQVPSHEALSDIDSQIAGIMQIQELDVADACSMAKHADKTNLSSA